jgi:uncharacterized membrane protein YkoI
MKSRKIVVVSVLAIAAATTAFAAESPKGSGADEAVAYGQVKMTLADAIALAERQTGGKAVEATLEQEHGTVSFEVEIMKDRAFQKVTIDARSGQVVSTRADHDQEEDGEQDDD